MANVEVRDNVLWLKHIHGDPHLRDQLESLPAESTVQLKVDGALGVWRKMKANARTNAATPGLQPVGPAANHWRSLFRDARGGDGVLVEIELKDFALIAKDRSRRSASAASDVTPAERRAAWEAIKDIWRTGGWRSEAPYGPRDELYDR